MFFSSDPAVSSSIFVGAEREELIRSIYTVECKVSENFFEKPSNLLNCIDVQYEVVQKIGRFSRIVLKLG